MICSACSSQIIGVGVVMADELRSEPAEGFITYHGNVEGEDRLYYLLHPVCFTQVFEEIIRLQTEAAMFVAVAVAGNIREALVIP